MKPTRSTVKWNKERSQSMRRDLFWRDDPVAAPVHLGYAIKRGPKRWDVLGTYGTPFGTARSLVQATDILIADWERNYGED